MQLETEKKIYGEELSRSFYSQWQPVSADLCIILICGITCLVIENYINFRGKCVRACRTSSTPAVDSRATVIVWVLSHLGKSGNKLAKISERMPIFIPLRARIDRRLPPVEYFSNDQPLIATRKHIYLLLHAISFQHNSFCKSFRIAHRQTFLVDAGGAVATLLKIISG